MQREKKKVKRFSKFMNNKMDYILFITVLILLSLGVVMVLSASAPSALSSTGKSYTYFLKQFEFALAGIGLMLFFSKSDYRFLRKYYKVIYVISVAILLLVLVPKLGKSVNGAKRWIEIKGIGQFQPSEFTKIGLIIFYAGYLSDHKNDLKQFGKGFVLPMAFFNSSNCNIVLCSKPFKCIFGCRYCNLCNDVNGWMQAVAFYVCWSGRSRGSSLSNNKRVIKR